LYQIDYYTTGRGDSPVKDFLLELDKKSLAKAMVFIEELEKKDLI